ncbi:MAG: TrpR-related protein YerC/YecD [Bacilli bacterium]|nr:TrpR-related protein YerC/YecD [Bacilli bacterium]
MKHRDYKELFDEILKLETEEECAKFFDDLCTINELDSMLQRIKAAKMLLEDKTFQEVIKETQISSATLARVSKCIKYGDGGYKDIIEKKKK